jgi:hypothetical protein
MRKYAIVAAGLLVSVVLGATVFREPIAWAAQSIDATIVGPLDNGNVRVHEEGTANVNVTGTPTVNAQQRGAWNVGITGTPIVSVETPEFVQAQNVLFLNGNQAGDVELYTVPEGKRLIVTYVDVRVLGSPSDVLQIYLSNAGLAPRHWVPLTHQGGPSFVAGQLVNFSFPAGTHVTLTLVCQSAPSDFPNAEGGFTGYLVDA